MPCRIVPFSRLRRCAGVSFQGSVVRGLRTAEVDCACFFARCSPAGNLASGRLFCVCRVFCLRLVFLHDRQIPNCSRSSGANARPGCLHRCSPEKIGNVVESYDTLRCKHAISAFTSQCKSKATTLAYANLREPDVYFPFGQKPGHCVSW